MPARPPTRLLLHMLPACPPCPQGTIPGHAHSYALDDHHTFQAGKWYEVCGNTGKQGRAGMQAGRAGQGIGRQGGLVASLWGLWLTLCDPLPTHVPACSCDGGGQLDGEAL
jgi:hypothetical protein